MRKAWLDNIRFSTVLLVLVYHVFYLFNGVGAPGGIPEAKNIPVFDTLAAVIYPWFMVLLFVIAGISARYALAGDAGSTAVGGPGAGQAGAGNTAAECPAKNRRTEGQFIRERAVRLLVPSTLGLFAVHWITGYLNIRMGGGLAYIPPALLYPIAAVSGTGPLWFAQMLFLFSCVLVLLRKADRKDRVWTVCGKANLPVILLLSLPLFGAAQVLNLPVLTMYRFGIYLCAFLIGYYIFSHESVQDLTERVRIPMACLAVIGAVLYAVYYGGSDYTAGSCLQSAATNFYLWIVVLAVIGCGRKYFDRETEVTRYLSRAGFGLYVLHYPVLIAVCYVLCYDFDIPAIWNYAIALAAAFILTFTAYELIRRIPLLRYVVLGIKN